MKYIIMVLLGLLLMSHSYGKQEDWLINKDHSEILFKIPFLKLSSITGRFTNFKGLATYEDENSVMPAKVYIEIDVSSIFTGNKVRDGHLKKEDFFAIKKFPVIRFESDQIKPVGPETFQIQGRMTIKDVTNLVTFSMTMSDSIEDTWEKKNKFVHFKAQINRQEFQLHWNKAIKDNGYILGDNVDIQGTFQLQPRNGKTAPYTYFIPNTKSVKEKDDIRLGNKLRKKERTVEEKIEEIRRAPLPNEVFDKKAVGTVKNKPQNDKHMDSSEKKTKSAITKENFYWWLSYFTIGLLAFVGLIYVIVEFKKMISRLAKNYEESNAAGILSDLPVYAIVLIYAMAMWELMILV